MYRRTFDPRAQDSLAKLARWVPVGATVLELGPATGYFTRHLREVGCIVDVVEIDPEAAAQVADLARTVVVGDLAVPATLDELGGRRYDIVVCADVLEHLVDGAALLGRLRALLAPQGQLLLSVPNVAHSAIIAGLLEERFDYGREGLLDPTHVRLYTRHSLAGVLDAAGFVVDEWDSVVVDLYATEFRTRIEHFRPAIADLLQNRSNGSVYQWLVRARAADGSPSAQAASRQDIEGVPMRVIAAESPGRLTLDGARTLTLRAGAPPTAFEVVLTEPAGALRLMLADRVGVVDLPQFELCAGDRLVWSLRDGSGGYRMSNGVVRLGGVRIAVLEADAWIDPILDVSVARTVDRVRITAGWPTPFEQSEAFALFNELAGALMAARSDAVQEIDRLTRLVAERDVWLKAVQERMLATAPASVRATTTIDIVIPVYNAPEDLAKCVDSVLEHTSGGYRLILIDDGSPDPAIREYFSALERRALPQVVLLRNEVNLGFTRTANRGMLRGHDQRLDVVLLNSDTVVTAGWLDAFRRCAASSPHIGTITPFSNNAEICSFPRFCVDNEWPDGQDPEPMRAALAGAAVPSYPDIPTGVGFCMFVRRALIEGIGVFDVAFGHGYGEENDFCVRAAKAGWRNVLCDDAFVLHLGARSFAGRKAELGQRNLPLLLERHPEYDAMVRSYIEADPLRAIRDAALARLSVATRDRHGILHIVHGHGGGTERHVRSLVGWLRAPQRHYLAIAMGDTWTVEEHDADCSIRSFDFRREPDESWEHFVGGLCASLGIDLLHLHNILGCRPGLLKALNGLGLPFGYTVHDLSLACPTITLLGPDGRYCGGETEIEACRRCLSAQASFAAVDVAEWRSEHGRLLRRAAFLIAPSQWAADMLRRYFAGLAVEVLPHALPVGPLSGTCAGEVPRLRGAESPLTGVVTPDDGVPTVAVLGAIGPDKGARRIERLVDEVRATDARVRFVVIGYLDSQQLPCQSEDRVLTVHGRYAPEDLPALLDHYRVRLVAFPSAGPESFSFTLSEAWAAGRPVIVPPIGALAERVAGSGAGWVWSDGEWGSEVLMLARIATITGASHVEALQAAAAAARAMPRQTLKAMAERTAELYEAVAKPSPAGAQAWVPFPAVRMRDALGYRPWFPPRIDEASLPDASGAEAEPVAGTPPGSAGPGGPVAWIARKALGWRRTWFGELLHSMTPRFLLEAMKSRLAQ